MKLYKFENLLAIDKHRQTSVASYSLLLTKSVSVSTMCTLVIFRILNHKRRLPFLSIFLTKSFYRRVFIKCVRKLRSDLQIWNYSQIWHLYKKDKSMKWNHNYTTLLRSWQAFTLTIHSVKNLMPQGSFHKSDAVFYLDY